MNNSDRSMGQAFAKLKNKGSVTLESKSYDQILVWEKAFREKLGPFSFFQILVSVQWARGQYNLTATLEKIEPSSRHIKRPHKITTEVSEEQAFKNYHLLYDDDPIAENLIKEAYEAGMIPGIRSIVSVKRLSHNANNAQSEPLAVKK